MVHQVDRAELTPQSVIYSTKQKCKIIWQRIDDEQKRTNCIVQMPLTAALLNIVRC